jgi:hypothetical protein
MNFVLLMLFADMMYFCDIAAPKSENLENTYIKHDPDLNKLLCEIKD